MRSLFKTLAAATDGGLTGKVNSILSGMHTYACRYRWSLQGYQRMDDASPNRFEDRGGLHVMPCHSRDGITLHGAERHCRRKQKSTNFTNMQHMLKLGQHPDFSELAQANIRHKQVNEGQGPSESPPIVASLQLPSDFGFRILSSPLAHQIPLPIRSINRCTFANVSESLSPALGAPSCSTGDQKQFQKTGHAKAECQASFNRPLKVPPHIGRRHLRLVPETPEAINLSLQTQNNRSTASKGETREDWAHNAPFHAWGRTGALLSTPVSSHITRNKMGCIHCWDELFKHRLPMCPAKIRPLR